MPRSLWTGAISFGLVNVPVRLYSAVSEHKLHFHLVHEKDSSPIGYQKICKAEEKPVPEKEIVKAFRKKALEYHPDKNPDRKEWGQFYGFELGRKEIWVFFQPKRCS